MKLTENFALIEFERSDTAKANKIDNSVPKELHNNAKRLAEFLQELRDALGVRIYVTSGYRCMPLNRLVGGAAMSAHAECLAADIHAQDHTPEQLFQKIIELDLDYDQVIQEFDRWVHVGLSTSKPRKQKLRATKNSAGKTVYTPV